MDTVPNLPDDIQWRPVVGYEGFYEISNYGHVRTLMKRKSQSARKMLLPMIDRFGYHRYGLTGEDRIRRYYAAHILVYKAFVGEVPDHLEIDHIDGAKSNNHIGNLQLLTHQQNTKKAWANRRKIEAQTLRGTNQTIAQRWQSR